MKKVSIILFLLFSLHSFSDINLANGDFMICNGHDSHFTYEFYLIDKASGQAFVKTVVAHDQEHRFQDARYQEFVNSLGEKVGKFSFGHEDVRMGKAPELSYAIFNTTTPEYHYEGQVFYFQLFDDSSAEAIFCYEILLCTFNW